MTEREAWLFLADKWDNVEGDEHPRYVVVNGYEAAGLCPCIDSLESADDITPPVAAFMLAKIPKKRDSHDACWPFTEEGAKARAAFCRKQARLLAPKRRKKVRA